jgi:NarL family two-component system response regulator LiaR
VLIVEDDSDWIKAMTAFLNREEDMLVVGSAAGAAEAIQLARSLSFDVALIDIQLTGSERNGIEIALEMQEIQPAAKMIMLTAVDDAQAMTQSFTAGAVNYIEKTNYRQLPHAIRAAYHHPAPMDALLKELYRLKREELLQPLTPAEREIFELMEAGYTQAEMAKKLFKSEQTLKNQVNKILKKLGVRSSREAVAKVRRRGLGGSG